MIGNISKSEFDSLNLSPQSTSLWDQRSEAAWFASDDRELLGVITSDARLMHWTLIICRRRAEWPVWMLEDQQRRQRASQSEATAGRATASGRMRLGNA